VTAGPEGEVHTIVDSARAPEGALESQAGPEGEVHTIVDGEAPFVRRRIVVWRRLEPGDVRTPGSVNVPESPFLEAKVVDIALPRAVHDEMKRLASVKASTTAIPKSPLLEYEPAGVLISAAGGIGIGVWLEYLRPIEVFQPIAIAAGILGVGLALVAKSRRRKAENEAAERWRNAPEREDYERMARDLAAGWARFVHAIKERGFHTEIRVAEGSNDPLRLASLDPRPFQGAQGFDPEDWLPTEGEAGVRYEVIHVGGEIATRLLPGSVEYREPREGARATAAAGAPAAAGAEVSATTAAAAEPEQPAG
jgi:hypothetical protein